MSTPDEKIEAIKFAVETAKRRLATLNSKQKLNRVEQHEKEMTLNCIKEGERLLDINHRLEKLGGLK